MNPSPQLQKAMALLQQQPLPSDIEAQLEALEHDAPAAEADMFGDLWSSVTMLLPPEDLK